MIESGSSHFQAGAECEGTAQVIYVPMHHASHTAPKTLSLTPSRRERGQGGTRLVAVALCGLSMALLLRPAKADDNVAARIDDDVVYVSEVERELARVINDRPVDPRALRLLQAKTLQQLVDRRLITNWLNSVGKGASKAEVDLAVQRLEKRLGQRDRTLAEHLAELKMPELELRRLLEWQIGWQRFVARYASDENLQKFFEQHRRDFDGTKLRVAHILLKADGNDVSPVIDEATRVRQEITSGKLTFTNAAKKYSAAPTGKNGGDIGLISRRQPMPESFSKAAFELAEGETSKPVVTAFGVHLIHCLKIEPGQGRWHDARDELREAVTKYLFTWAADRRRANAKIEFTGAMPHFEPGTETLVD